MIYLILWLLTALTGVTEDAPVPMGEVVIEECQNPDSQSCETSETGATPPSELPGPH